MGTDGTRGERVSRASAACASVEEPGCVLIISGIDSGEGSERGWDGLSAMYAPFCR